MKKFFALILVFALALTLFAGCQNDVPEDPTDSDGQGDEAPLTVAMVIAGALGDKGFNDSAKAGLDKAVEELGVVAQVVEIPTSDPTKFEPTLMDLAESGEYDLITVAGNALREILERVAIEYPEQKFYLYDASVDYNNGTFENVYCNTFLQNEASFLGGMVAAGMTTSDLPDMNEGKNIGCILMMDMAVINDFMVGYIEGALYVDPEIQINTAYIGAVDAAKAKDMALGQYQTGTDIIFQVAASSGLGVIEAAVERDGYVIGVDQDQAMVLMETNPEGANRILTSVLKRVDVAVYRVLEMMSGEDTVQWGTSEALGMQDGCVGIAKTDVYQALVSDEIKAMVEDAEAKIASGEIVVGTAFGMDADALTELRNSVKP